MACRTAGGTACACCAVIGRAPAAQVVSEVVRRPVRLRGMHHHEGALHFSGGARRRGSGAGQRARAGTPRPAGAACGGCENASCLRQIDTFKGAPSGRQADRPRGEPHIGDLLWSRTGNDKMTARVTGSIRGHARGGPPMKALGTFSPVGLVTVIGVTFGIYEAVKPSGPPSFSGNIGQYSTAKNFILFLSKNVSRHVKLNVTCIQPDKPGSAASAAHALFPAALMK